MMAQPDNPGVGNNFKSFERERRFLLEIRVSVARYQRYLLESVALVPSQKNLHEG